MLHNLRFFLFKMPVYFIMLPCLVPVLFAFYLQGVLKFKCKIPAPKVSVGIVGDWYVHTFCHLLRAVSAGKCAFGS